MWSRTQHQAAGGMGAHTGSARETCLSILSPVRLPVDARDLQLSFANCYSNTDG